MPAETRGTVRMLALWLTHKQVIALLHLAFALVLAHVSLNGFWCLYRSKILAGFSIGYLKSMHIILALLSWLTVLSGTWVLLPWYRQLPANTRQNLLFYPQAYLTSQSHLADWHHFAMDWKQNIGWLTPFLSTFLAYALITGGGEVYQDPALRRVLSLVYVTLIISTLVPTVLGILINTAGTNSFLNF